MEGNALVAPRGAYGSITQLLPKYYLIVLSNSIDKQVGPFHFWPLLAEARKHTRDRHMGHRGGWESGRRLNGGHQLLVSAKTPPRGLVPAELATTHPHISLTRHIALIFVWCTHSCISLRGCSFYFFRTFLVSLSIFIEFGQCSAV